MNKNKSDIYASIGTIIASVLIVLLLLYCGMTASRNEVDEGLMVSFGDEIEGFGTSEQPEPQPEQVAEPTTTPPPPTTPAVTQVAENLMTQVDESVVLEQEKKRKQREEQERQRKIEEQKRLERERKAAEERRIAEQQRIAAEQKAKSEKANALAGVFGKNSGSGSGTSTGDSMQGNPAGSGTSGGNGWSLRGRNLQGGLPKPSYSGNDQGTIVVNIRVDRNGNVTDANIDNSKTNIGDKSMRDASIAAAKRAKFSAANDVAIGTITYNFRLNQ